MTDTYITTPTAPFIDPAFFDAITADGWTPTLNMFGEFDRWTHGKTGYTVTHVEAQAYWREHGAVVLPF